MLGSLDFHRYTGNIVDPNIVKSGFHCNTCYSKTVTSTINYIFYYILL